MRESLACNFALNTSCLNGTDLNDFRETKERQSFRDDVQPRVKEVSRENSHRYIILTVPKFPLNINNKRKEALAAL